MQRYVSNLLFLGGKLLLDCAVSVCKTRQQIKTVLLKSSLKTPKAQSMSSQPLARVGTNDPMKASELGVETCDGTSCFTVTLHASTVTLW